jgi:hypothetical protein
MKGKIQKIFLSILIIVFFIANVSFTVVLHYCEMMKQISKSECGMCEEDDSISDFGNLSFNDLEDGACCKNFVKTTNQIDDVILKKSDNSETKLIQYVSILALDLQEISTSFSIKLINYHSPPENIPIHLKNSVLLI